MGNNDLAEIAYERFSWQIKERLFNHKNGMSYDELLVELQIPDNDMEQSLFGKVVAELCEMNQIMRRGGKYYAIRRTSTLMRHQLLRQSSGA